MKRWLLPLCAVLLVGLAGASAPHPTRAQSGQLVTIRNGAFSPDVLTITAGDYVDWLNFDSTDHTATSDTGAWDTGTISGVQTVNGVTVTSGSDDIFFTTAGTYPYHDRFNAAMRGTIVVQTAASASPSPTETSVSTAMASPTATPSPTPTAATATPAASPTLTAAPSIPSGQELLAQMRRAVAAKNTFHEVLHVNQVIESTMRVVVNYQIDASLKPALEHFVGTIRTTHSVQPTTKVTQREEIVVIKKKAAARTGKQAWSCSSVNQISPNLLMSARMPTLESAENLGPAVVRSIPVWHVRAAVVVNVADKPTTAVGQYYISRADFTLVRATTPESFTASGVTVKQTIVQDFTKYGEKVTVTLPAACKRKSTGSDALVWRGQHGAQASWTPVWPLRLPRAPGGR